MLILHDTDDGHFCHFAWAVAAFINDGQICTHTFCQFTRTRNTANIGADHGDIRHIWIVMFHIQCENGCRIKVIHWNIKKALNLGCMKINSKDAFDASFDQHIGDKLR